MHSTATGLPDIGSRLRHLRFARDMTQKEFAASVGIVQGFLSSVESGKKQPSDTLLIAVCHHFGVRRDWLLHGKGEMSVAAPPPDAGAATPLLKRISAAFPEIDPEDIEDFVRLPGLPPGCYALRVEGDYMAPTISDGDLVIFEPGGDWNNRDIVLVTNRWGEAILRRLRRHGDEVYLSAENATYVPFRPDPETRTLGKVVAIWRRVKI